MAKAKGEQVLMTDEDREQLMSTRRQLRQIIAAAARSLEYIEEMLKLPEDKRYRPSAN
ncbi:MAG: hypothetical protein IAE79_05860 [Anaerolinea sp.]|nr:hypothetical protein [Anaerolinea sp.]